MAFGLTSLIKRKPRKAVDFLADDAGVTAIEFGILAVPFFMIVGAILESSVVFMAGQVLDSAVQDSSRFIRTGEAQAAGLDLTKFRSQICSRLYGLFSDCNALHIEVNTITDFASVNIQPPVDWSCKTSCGWTRSETYPAGYAAGPSAVIAVQVYYKWPVILSFLGGTLSDLPDNQRLLGAAAVFRNEPFPGA